MLNEYEVIRRIGQGTYGTVYIAIHKATQKQVALKVLDVSQYNEDNIKLVRQEIEIFQSMNHPFIARCFDIKYDVNQIVLVMEYATLGTLREYINDNGRATEEEANRLFVQLISVLDYMHNVMKVAHRDIKNENIILDESRNIRLIDFGFSKHVSEGLVSQCGSVCYMAPEVIKGTMYEPSSDIWSAGIILYSTLAGTLPFYDVNQSKLLEKILNDEAERPSSISQNAWNLILKILQKDPSKRITIEQIKHDPWFVCFRYNVDAYVRDYLDDHKSNNNQLPSYSVSSEILDRSMELTRQKILTSQLKIRRILIPKISILHHSPVQHRMNKPLNISAKKRVRKTYPSFTNLPRIDF